MAAPSSNNTSSNTSAVDTPNDPLVAAARTGGAPIHVLAEVRASVEYLRSPGQGAHSRS